MIFITVGTQLPFDRLLNNVAKWREQRGYSGNIIAQVGNESRFTHSDIHIVKTLSSDEYYKWFCQAQSIISHAGMGSILSCLEHGKRGVFMPRQFSLGEHRNDHQLDTVKAFSGQYSSLYFCLDSQALFSALDQVTMEEHEAVVNEKNDDNTLGMNIAKYLKLRGQ